MEEIYPIQTTLNYDASRLPARLTRGANDTSVVNSDYALPEDFVMISEAAREQGAQPRGEASSAPTSATGSTAETTEQSETTSSSDGSQRLSDEELRVVEEMKKEDARVRQHEMAHLMAAGQYARGGMTLDYERGPDGNLYAVGGRVNIDTSVEPTPRETIQKMQTIQRAALAPAEPSPTDRQVASEAALKESQARMELSQEQIDAMAIETTEEKDAIAVNQPESATNRRDITVDVLLSGIIHGQSQIQNPASR